ncbi:YcaO-like family protein [Spirochaetota bacterium]
MLRNYPSHTHLRNRFAEICSQHVGILESQIFTTLQSVNFPEVQIFTNTMPQYHKLLISEEAEISYHLSGYGIYKEEGLIRLLGEGIERYALVLAQTLYKNRIEYSSYNDIMKKGEVLPFEYMKLYLDNDLEELVALDKFKNIKNITKDDVIGWIKCPSIFDAGREIYIPAQFLFIGYTTSKEHNDCHFTLGFSKGVASHTNFKKAFKSAIMEAVEADSSMINWYTKMKCKRVKIDDPTLQKVISEALGKLPIEVFPVLMDLPDMPGHTFGLVLINKKNERPFFVMGCQSGLDPVQSLYRAFLEALGILYLGTYGALFSPQDFLETSDEKRFINLDSNVSYYADPSNTDEKLKLLKDMCKGEIALSEIENLSMENDEQEILYMLKKLRPISEYGVYLDITPPETADKGWRVVRTFFPELVQMSLPDFPYSNHPRIKEYGGIKNKHPHPLP